MRKKYNTPHRSRVIKTRLTGEEYAEFSERVSFCQMSQAEYIRQALTKSRIRPVITVSPVNDGMLLCRWETHSRVWQDRREFEPDCPLPERVRRTL